MVLESELAALEIINYAQKHQLPIGINYCSFFFKNRFQAAGFRTQLAKAIAKPGAVITQKGFIREYNNNSISYQAPVIKEGDFQGSGKLRLRFQNKTCSINTETAMNERRVGENIQMVLNNLLTKEPVKIPSDEFLFNIWQMEYIEKGLRRY